MQNTVAGFSYIIESIIIGHLQENRHKLLYKTSDLHGLVNSWVCTNVYKKINLQKKSIIGTAICKLGL